MSTKIDHEKVTSNETYWRYGPPPNNEAKMLLLTVGRVAIVGRWGDGSSVIAWCPLPRRDKQKEVELGLL